METSLLQQWRRSFTASVPYRTSQIQFSLSFSHPSTVTFSPNFKPSCYPLVSSTVLKLNRLDLEEDEKQEHAAELTAKERRKLRNQKRESSKGISWREEVEEKLIKKPKKRFKTWTEELNLDNLADLGPQWWGIRVSRVTGLDRAELLARQLVKHYPHMEFKIYIPAVEEKKKLKNGSYSTKSKAMFPGCVFLRCVLNKEIHDFVREIDGIGGFIGSRVGNTKKQINRPRPVSEESIEAIFKQVKEEQEKADQLFQEQELKDSELDNEKASLDSISSSNSVESTTKDTKTKRRSKKVSQPWLLKDRYDKLLTPGSTVKIVSGAFAEFSGILKELDPINGKAAVAFTLLGKETIADIDISEIVAEQE